jgi:hypothetical protein
VILLWVDDFAIFGPDELVPGIKNELLSLFNCKDVGEMKEYVGCKIERDCARERLDPFDSTGQDTKVC